MFRASPSSSCDVSFGVIPRGRPSEPGGRGTSTDDDTGIAWAVCEALVESNAYCFFATHLDKLLDLAKVYPQVKLAGFRSSGGIRNISRHELSEGPTAANMSGAPNYGLNHAAICGFPETVVARALQIKETMSNLAGGLGGGAFTAGAGRAGAEGAAGGAGGATMAAARAATRAATRASILEHLLPLRRSSMTVQGDCANLREYLNFVRQQLQPASKDAGSQGMAGLPISIPTHASPEHRDASPRIRDQGNGSRSGRGADAHPTRSLDRGGGSSEGGGSALTAAPKKLRLSSRSTATGKTGTTGGV